MGDVLTIRDLRKSFGALKATDGVDLDLRSGEIHALIGPNGAGKSTLIKQITGEIRPDRGQISLEGRDLAGIDPPGRARLGLARSFQVSSVVASFSVLENAMLAAMGTARSEMRMIRPVHRDRALRKAAHDAIGRVGLDSRADIRAAELSHGERRALEIAMALTQSPRAFLLDEPMAGMGAEGSAALTALLSTLKRQAPILLVEHDMDAVFALADRISVLVYGQVIATGTVDDIRSDPEVRRSYLGDG